MSLEPFLAFFLIRYLRKLVKNEFPLSPWNKIFTIALYGIVVLFIIDLTLGTHHVALWIWYALLLGSVWLIFKEPGFKPAGKVMNAVLPLILLGFISDLIKEIYVDLYTKIETYLSLAFAVALTWMIASLLRSKKQQKALEEERKKTLQEEERRKLMQVQKDQLEILVKERTAMITQQKEDLQQAITELKATQTQLIQAEKMASLGELTAGIAHEIQNPLNFVNNFSEINAELIEEMKNELVAGNNEEALSIANDIKGNEEKINHHGKRADAIVKGMLQHSRSSTGQKEPADINALADEYLRLSYHGLRAKNKSFNATMKTDFDESIGKINIIAQDIGRVLLNLFNNAFYAASVPPKGGFSGPEPKNEPTVWVSTKKVDNKILVSVRDNGPGIPQNVADKIFQPFFTTKPTGEGTGLGLSLSYDIIKAHGGEIKVETKQGEGTEFIVVLPES